MMRSLLILLSFFPCWRVVAAVASRAGEDSPACAKISSLYTNWAANEGQGDFRGFDSGLAYACLQSMPFDADAAMKFLDELTGYLQFHSTLHNLKVPPRGYVSLPVDIPGGLDEIRLRTHNKVYTGQYEFDRDVGTLIARANDGHLQIGLCSQEIFHFEHAVPLVSLSTDGVELPQMFVWSDVKSGPIGSAQASPVVEINDADAVWYLESQIGLFLGLQDPDARYNRIFPQPSANFTGAYSGGAWTRLLGQWPGLPVQTVRFANGSKLDVETIATWPATNGGMTYGNGEALYRVACAAGSDRVLGSLPGRFLTQLLGDIPPSGPNAYPRPAMRSENDMLPTFSLGNGTHDAAAEISSFINQATGRGVQRLILDLSGNEGGDINPGFSLFKSLFPDKPIHSATRFRTTELLGLMGQTFSAAWMDEAILDPPLIANQARDPSQKHISTSWSDMIQGGQKLDGDTMSIPYAHFDLDKASTSEDPIRGFGGSRLDPKKQPFNAKDIIIMTNGICASTCALLVELLQDQGVRSIVFGGRPRKGPMQAVGGVKGGQRWSIAAISRHVSTALELAKSVLEPKKVFRLAKLSPPSRGNLSLRFDDYGQSSVNFRNAYGKDDYETPLQFVYHAADCRRFITRENLLAPATMWRDAALAMFEHGGSCVTYRS